MNALAEQIDAAIRDVFNHDKLPRPHNDITAIVSARLGVPQDSVLLDDRLSRATLWPDIRCMLYVRLRPGVVASDITWQSLGFKSRMEGSPYELALRDELRDGEWHEIGAVVRGATMYRPRDEALAMAVNDFVIESDLVETDAWYRRITYNDDNSTFGRVRAAVRAKATSDAYMTIPSILRVAADFPDPDDPDAPYWDEESLVEVVETELWGVGWDVAGVAEDDDDAVEAFADEYGYTITEAAWDAVLDVLINTKDDRGDRVYESRTLWRVSE